ncbi:hypothetical protein [Paenibacillus soyae]|uniref:Uncharacterized protein n=1 Tax=Paenibacillus soyae TaxID=2969249 RepID=A0A9X2S7G9_9BACL|nr:hypothetical protein [Paenibacillus soyae]MCR2803314.1 hypothetical protein [Paenibacillus soyae]
MPQMRWLGIIILCFAIGLAGCSRGGGPSIIAEKSASEGPFELIVEVQRLDDQRLQLIRKLKFSGDQDIEISHSDPLISISYSADGNAEAHHFDDIGLTSALQKKETLTYGEPIVVERIEEAKHVSAFAYFTYLDTRYHLSVEITL